MAIGIREVSNIITPDRFVEVGAPGDSISTQSVLCSLKPERACVKHASGAGQRLFRRLLSSMNRIYLPKLKFFFRSPPGNRYPQYVLHH
jgi:hypothetical protein